MSTELTDTEVTEVEELETAEVENGSTDSVPDNESETTEEFDASIFEVEFGLPEGSLKDAKSADDVMAIVRESVDKTLIAGLGQPAPTQQPAAPAGFQSAADVIAKGGKKDGEGAAKLAPEIQAQFEAMQKRIDELEGASQRAVAQDLERRLQKEIDSWKSDKYGSGKTRNFKQARAKKELEELIITHALGFRATGQAIPDVEVLARQVRAFDDDTYKPTAKKPAQTPLGTPGTGKADKGGAKEPRNIHEALMRNPY